MKKVLIILLAVLILAGAGTAGYMYYSKVTEQKEFEAAESPALLAEKTAAEIRNSSAAALVYDGRVILCGEPETAEGREIYSLLKAATETDVSCSVAMENRTAEAVLKISGADPLTVSENIRKMLNSALAAEVEAAKYSSDVYDENLCYRPEIIDAAFAPSWEQGIKSIGAEKESSSFSFSYSYDRESKAWHTDFSAEIQSGSIIDELALQIKENAMSEPQYIRKHYAIDEKATVAPKPDQNCFGETDDPAVVQKIVESPLAQQLIGDRTMVWNPDLPFIPGTLIRYYLDETILAIEWQEPEAKTMGTFCEIIVQDGSQIRRKIANDAYCAGFNLGTILSEQANAVFASGGDLYYHGRNCGIVVYDREIYRFDNVTCDTCYINTNGDLFFSYRSQFSDISQARAFVDENDILYSLCFGPVLIDNGEDVTPWTYNWGEVNEEYARAALGQLGEHHYLTMNMNCKAPDYYYLATLRSAADAMIKRGCINAYALDGGQTATTIVNNKLINPVQFGEEKVTSDILYFATALPERE